MNKLIVVTGGTKGIGKAIVARFAKEGFDVATCARNIKDLKDLKEEIEGLYPVSVLVQNADLSKTTEVKAFAGYVTGLGRPIDVLVNNAGFFKPGQITEEPEGTLEQTVETNLYSAYYMTRGLITQMMARGEGHIFNMCSIASIKAYPNGGAYAISKFALLGFSKVLREEVKASGIRVTAVLPGATRTASWDGTELPEDRFMPSEDVADAVYAAYALSGRSVVEEMIIRPQLGDI